MASACELIDVELAVDRLEAELAAELPSHIRAFARAHAAGRPPPPAPPVARRPASVATARRAFAHPELADRGLPLLRLLAPIAIEDDPTVAAARGLAPTWGHYAALAAARDRIARAVFGRGVIELLHRLHGVAGTTAPSALAGVDGAAQRDAALLAIAGVDGAAAGGAVTGDDRPAAQNAALAAVDGWHTRDAAIGADAVEAAWHAIASATGVVGAVRIERASADAIRSRAFIVEPGVEVIVVVPAAIDTPAARFVVLHELGHAVCALASRTPAPRAVDEAVASRVARLMEGGGVLEPCWASPVATEARHRRRALAAVLDRHERGLAEVDRHERGSAEAIDRRASASTTGPLTAPTWAMWHDPGAQAAYGAAEAIAAGLRLDGIRADIARERARIDLATTL